jgi:integrase
MKPRLSLPRARWPNAWRTGWERATAPSNSLFSPSAKAAGLRAGTLSMREEALEMFLGFMDRSGRLQAESLPGDVVAEATIQAYVDEQKARGLLNSTIVIRLTSLVDGLRMIFPGMPFDFILHPGGRPLSEALPHRPRRVEVRDHRELLALALALNQEGLRGTSYAGGKTALRDAAIIGLLAAQGTRVRSLAAMELNRDLVRREGVYCVILDDEDTKMGQPYECPLPKALTPVFDDYLQIARPGLGGCSTTKLWLSISREPLTKKGLTEVARTRTRTWFGAAKGTHWFRKCIVSTIRLVAPELAGDAALVLDHSPAIAQQHYDMGNGVAAAQRHNERMERLFSRTAARADAAFRDSMPKANFMQMRRTKPGCW